MEEEFEKSELVDINQIRTKKLKKNDKIIKKDDLSISVDPIPHLIKPMKKPITLHSSMSYIISNYPNMNQKMNKIHHIAKNKIGLYLINQNLQQHNSTPHEKCIMIINDLINSKETHFTSVFKDYLIYDYNEEFLRGYFSKNDCRDVLPKFYEYYKNYLNFFCKGTFASFYANNMMQEYGEYQAEIYYNINYVKKEGIKKKEKKGNIDEKNIEETENNKQNNISSLISFRTFFTKSIENSIRRVKNSKDEILYKKNMQELSNIKPVNDNKENTIYLPENTTVSIDDVITKKSSIVNIIDLMKKKNKKNFSNKNKSKKIELIINNKKLNHNDNKNFMKRKFIKSFSKTTSNLNDKKKKKITNIYSKSKKNLSGNKGSNTKYNNDNNKISTSSNFIKYIDILSSKKNIKSNVGKVKIPKNELILSSTKIIKKKRKSINNINNIPQLNTNTNVYSNPLFPKNISKGSKNKNKNSNISKSNLSLKIKNFYHKIKKVNNTSSLYPLSTSKSKSNRNNSNNNKKSRMKDKSLSKNQKANKYIYMKQKIGKQKKLKGTSFSPRNNCAHNKSLSYSTLNNCNININNNIILSNNYFNNKHGCLQQQISNSSKRLLDKNLAQKKSKLKNNNSRPLTSRNIQIDLDKYKTEENILNSIVLHGASYKILKNKSNIDNNNIQYTSFRKGNNKRLLINQSNLFKNKKNFKEHNNKKNLTLKDIPFNNKARSNLYSNYSNRIKKLQLDDESNSTNKVFKELNIKINNNNQNKVIFDYKKK